jgi:subtilase family serine protease
MGKRVVAVLVVVLSAGSFGAAAAGAANGHSHAVCQTSHNAASCSSLVVTDAHGKPNATTAPTGLSPAMIKTVYGFPTATTAGAGKTIAIVDAYNDPTAESDLGVFSQAFGLPACTTANGCFSKVNQTGGSTYPATNAGWALEISLDIQWAHAIAPGAKILLVEASSNSFANLLAAEDYAKTHAQYVSNSWGGSEFSGENSFDSHFVQNGVSFFVSAGDAGLPAEYPSTSPNVISVGGTTLHFNGAGAFTSETGWTDGGGGCSAYEAAPSAQSGFAGYAQAGCAPGRRATPDVSLDADPASGVSVYDSTPYQQQQGWFTVGGTSASSPMWAARSADLGQVVDAAYVYGNAIPFRDIVSGNNGAACLVGYDLCSGRGSWATAAGPVPTLVFTTAPKSLTAGVTSSAITVQLQNGSGAPLNAAADLTVSLSSPATGTFSPSGTVTIAAGTSMSPDFFYSDTKAGSPVLTATAAGTTDGSQTETVNAASLAAITVTPGSATVNTGGTQLFTAAGADQFSNPVDVSGAVWSATIGTVSAGPGATTTFTAGANAGTGSVFATVSPIQGSASVTVVAASLPGAPTSLAARPANGHGVQLSWVAPANAGSSPVTSYRIYRSTTAGAEKLLTSTTATSFKDTSTSRGVQYFYRVSAVNAAGEGSPSNEAAATAK